MVGERSVPMARRALAIAVSVVVTSVSTGCAGLGHDGVETPPATQTAAPSPTSTPPASTPPTSSSPSPSSPTRRPTPTATSVPTTPPTPTATATSVPTTPATPTPAPTPTETAPPRTTLILGDRGPAVLELQERLSALGYWLGTPDGVFGGLTQQAVFALQKAAGIGRDGVVGPRTKAALEAGTRPGSRVGGTGVEIDLDRQLLLIVRDGAVTRILNTSTGNGEEYVSRGTTKIARTPTGSFAVFREVDALEVAELGELYRPKYFYKGWAVHGSPSVPPYPASHGCARVTNAAITMIWDRGYLDIGTPVTVY